MYNFYIVQFIVVKLELVCTFIFGSEKQADICLHRSCTRLISHQATSGMWKKSLFFLPSTMALNVNFASDPSHNQKVFIPTFVAPPSPYPLLFPHQLTRTRPLSLSPPLTPQSFALTPSFSSPLLPLVNSLLTYLGKYVHHWWEMLQIY